MTTRIYTRSGDGGSTGLFGGQRVDKDALRVEAYGTVDELNAVLGMARAAYSSAESVAELDNDLQTIQNELFLLGADLATPDKASEDKGRIHIERVRPAQSARLETLIDGYESTLPPLTQFILPGGTAFAAALHHARVVCRRAERRCVTLARTEADGETPINPEIVRYLNRLSDLLFVMARAANARQGAGDVLWQSPRGD